MFVKGAVPNYTMRRAATKGVLWNANVWRSEYNPPNKASSQGYDMAHSGFNACKHTFLHHVTGPPNLDWRKTIFPKSK